MNPMKIAGRDRIFWYITQAKTINFNFQMKVNFNQFSTLPNGGKMRF